VLTGALAYLVQIVFGLFTVALLLRFHLQCVRAPLHNPLSDFLHALTSFLVRPARRVIPGLMGLDLATLVLAWLAQFIQLFLILQIRGYQTGPEAGLAFVIMLAAAAVMVCKIALYIVMVTVVAQAVLSWVSPYSPVMPLLNSLTRPFLRVFQRRVPLVGGVDLSPLFVIIVCQLLLIAPIAHLEHALARAL
jgi:YggT family protein